MVKYENGAYHIYDSVFYEFKDAVGQMWATGEVSRHPELMKEGKLIPFDGTDNTLISECWIEFFANTVHKKYPHSALVYFIENYNGERIKIGKTKNLGSRYQNINNTSGGDCRIVYAMPVKSPESAHDLERVMHRAFPGQRLNGEWFVAKGEQGNHLADLIKSLYFNGSTIEKR